LSGNSIGKTLVMTCFGESHGSCIGVTVDGCPAGLPLTEKDLQIELDKRRPGFSSITTSRRERDEAEILSGVFKGYTTGAPITVIVRNRDVDSKPYEKIRDTPRPGHADYPARIRYGSFQDYRGGGRFSGRVTIAFVIAGAISKILLRRIGVEVLAHTIQIGRVKLSSSLSYEEIRRNTYENPVRCADLKVAKEMEEEIIRAAEEGDSVGGIVECLGLNLPIGLGSPIFDTLDGDLAKMLFNIPAVKGVEFGAGFQAASMKGSENNDEYTIREGRVVTTTNNAGGILGGLSTGMPLVARVAFKPTASINRKQKTVDLRTMKETDLILEGRYDPCIVPRAVPVVECSVAFVLADHALRQGFIPQVLSLNRKGELKD